ncbi:Plug domain-containing protein [Hymenobacter segetis]
MLPPALGLLATAPVRAQADSLGGLSRQLSRYEQRDPHEKLYLHLDRPVYLSGETMWFSLYAVDGTYSRPLPLSTVAYVEVLDAQNRPVLQSKVALQHAAGHGSLALPAALAAGSYHVRAYTSWMQNFGPEAYFQTTVTVINTFTASGTAGRDSATYDARFFPEGGNLVRDLRSKVAVKVTDRAGHGVAAEGTVLDNKGAVVATFATARLGMGSFSFTPTEGGQPYKAVLKLGSPGTTITRPLPRSYAQGYVMNLAETSPTQLTLTVMASSRQPETLFLLGHSRQKVALTHRLELRDGQATYIFDKAQLLDGVSHLTLFTAQRQPVCERLYFQAPPHRLPVVARADKAQYTTRSKVSVQVAATDAALPATRLSMAVYQLDSLTTAPPVAIDEYLWLTADLNGRVENPGYYLTATDAAARAAADNLMLTQGWSRWRWEDVLAPAPRPFEYLAEPNGHVITGRLTQAGTTQPRMGVVAYLASPSLVPRLSNSESTADGRIRFELPSLTGSREIVVQTDPQQDSTCQITLLNPFSTRYAAQPLPPFGLTRRFEPDYARRHLQAQVQRVYLDKFRRLAPAGPVDSAAFFGQANETYLLDKYTRFKVLEEVLREYVPGVVVRIRKDGFHLLVADRANKVLMEDNPMVLLDGVPVFNMNKAMAINPLKIRKLEVIDGRYFHGPATYNGLVSFTTYKGDLEGFVPDAHALVQQYEGVQQHREFYAPRYDTPEATQSRLPDLRNLLYWNPDISLTGAQPKALDFYTGDQAGRYLVVVQGLAANGLSGSTSFVLEVKPAL